MKTLNITPWNLGDFSYWKRYFQKDTLQPHWKGLYQVQLTNSCATILQGIDSWIHISHLRKQQALTGLTHYLATWKKDFQEFKQTASNRQLSQDDQTRFAYLFLAVISSLSFLVQSTEKGENLSDCWSCCQNVSLFMMSEIDLDSSSNSGTVWLWASHLTSLRLTKWLLWPNKQLMFVFL